MLHLQSLQKTYRVEGHVVTALDDVSLELPAGRFVALKGRSGCGKSTLLLAAGGLLRPDGGQVLVDGSDLYALSAEERAAFRAATIGFVFQQFHLVPYLSVLDNVLTATLGLETNRLAESRERAEMLIDKFGIRDRAAHRPGQLSVGERQRTALARALLNRPRLLLADEPTGNLDPASAAVVLDELAAFARDGGAVLLVTHDPTSAARADECLEMATGRLAAGVEKFPSLSGRG